MTKKMLIDALHPEEIRVAITQNGRLEEFDIESVARKPIKGNIYLAKVTRVEPSLQAAFVEYGGNRQGFLPFSEIHYDYYSIPAADKKKLQEALQKEVSEIEEEEEDDDNEIEDISDETEARPIELRNFYRKYKIQEVIKRNQIILVQVIKEERGQKGASITTYLSLAGKYCVLMPNTDKQGGVSRKIGDFDVRRRLRKIVREVDTPKGMSVIVRTAGSDRKKSEIKRDFEYLVKLWEKIRENALASTAPALVYEEADIVKRSIRDLYDSTIEEVLVEGETAYKSAKKFMNLITPTHGKNVKQHKKNTPIFWEYDIEDELTELYDTEVGLKSGGYIVLNPTEALVSIDVNSGKSTRERNVEGTALKTNIEAAEEIARQLRIRDLAGLIVIDFIDMLELRNKKTVERALKEALRKDRAKIQVGRISTFGLLEMSRQRIGSSFLEASTVTCSRCNGLGVVRTKESGAVMILREIEYEARRNKRKKKFDVFISEEESDYINDNHKNDIKEIEKDTSININIKADPRLMGAQFAFGKEELELLFEPLQEQQEDQEDKQKSNKKSKPKHKPIHQDDIDESELTPLDAYEDDEEEEDIQPEKKGNTNYSQRNKKSHRTRNTRGKKNYRNNNRTKPRRARNNNDTNGNVQDIDIEEEKPKTKSTKKEAADKEKDKSVLKNLWKKITD